MDSNKRLLEAAKSDDPELLELAHRPDWTSHLFVKKWVANRAKEGEPEMGAMRGQTVGDATGITVADSQVAATLEILSSVIRGFTRYMDDSFVRKYTTNTVQFKIPLTEYRELVSTIGVSGSAQGQGQFPHTEKIVDYATVDLSTPESEKGGKATWTRSLLEDVTFDVQGEMAEGLGHAIAYQIMTDILTKLLSAPTYKMPLVAAVSWTAANGISWTNFLQIVGAVDIGCRATLVTYNNATNMSNTKVGYEVYDTTAGKDLGYLEDFAIVSSTTNAGTGSLIVHGLKGVAANFPDNDQILIKDSSGNTACIINLHVTGGTLTDMGKRTYGLPDFALVSTDVYWQLFQIIQATNVLYEGSTDPVRLGVIKLLIGTAIVKQSLLPDNTVIALNSQKAIALVTRRTLKIEPVLFPVWNEYGFIGTVRYGVTLLFPTSIQLGQGS